MLLLADLETTRLTLTWVDLLVIVVIVLIGILLARRI